jgi:phosphatidylinositol 3-kinase
MYVTVELWADSKRLALPMQTSHKVFKNSRTWNEWLELPVSYSRIPRGSQLAITVWDLNPSGGKSFHAQPFGGTTIPLFDKDSTLQRGRQRCRIHRFKHADGYSDSKTPHIFPVNKIRNGTASEQYVHDEIAELERLDSLMKKHEMKEIPPNKWLDQMVWRKMEQLDRESHKGEVQIRRAAMIEEQVKLENGISDAGKSRYAAGLLPGVFYLYIELPRFDHAVVFTDQEYPAPVSTMQSTPDVRLKPPPVVSYGPGIDRDNDEETEPLGRLIRIYDPEVGNRDNPAESKHRRLVRSTRTGVLDRDLKPNAKNRDDLNLIMSYGPLQELTDEEKDLMWKFRHHLTRERRALTKFVKSVTWTDQVEARQAVAMLSKWTEIDVDDALELLGPTSVNPEVRAFAVDRLRKSDDDELLLYLLQLVQALKFGRRPPAENEAPVEMGDSALAAFLIGRAASNVVLGSYFHWYLMVECDDRTPGEDVQLRRIFAKVEYEFMMELDKRPDGAELRNTLLRQAELITLLSKISRDIRNQGGDRTRKIERLKEYLGDPKNQLTHFDPPLPLPLDPTVFIVGCFPEESTVFKSSLLPLFVTFRTSGGQAYPILFKTGDDLRQDQLVIQIIMLMDRLLRKENLDLKLSPYKILATGPQAGAVQFIPSSSLSAIISKHKTILAYLRHHNPDDAAPLGVRREAMETYVKSCAGYCVITYLLGVGDRHSDNLLLAPSGHFFHADFGYILGRDPKPFAPLMKLDPAMVAGMGGAGHAYHAQFKQFCFTAYASLRKSANLILNLFALMSEANIPDIRIEPDKAVLKVQQRFHLEMSEEEAIRGFEALISESAAAVMPQVIDALHGLVQGLRG